MHSNAMPSGASGPAETYGRAEADRRVPVNAPGRCQRPGPSPGTIRTRPTGYPRPRWRGCRSTCARSTAWPSAASAPWPARNSRAAAGVNSAKLRKDLSHLGSYGIRGVGYDVDYLVYQVSRTLGLTQDWPVVIVGAGNLGRALANYGGFVSRGFTIAAMLDCDTAIVGSRIARLTVRHVDELEAVVARHKVAIGVIATPAGSAQAVCDRLVAAGVTSILNFAPLVLSVPEGVDVRKVDLSIELQILAFHAQRRSAARPADAADTGNAGPPAAFTLG